MSKHLNGPRAGGQATARILRAAVLAAYYANPNLCHHCGIVIPVPEGAKVPPIRKKKFCTRRCAAIFNNIAHPKRQRNPVRTCIACGTTYEKYNRRRLCTHCYDVYRDRLSSLSKSEVEKTQIYEHSRRQLKQEAPSCARCGYDRFVDVCHIRPVRDFPPDALISEINAKTNLITLCPNCHHEFDAGLFAI